MVAYYTARLINGLELVFLLLTRSRYKFIAELTTEKKEDPECT